MTTVGQPAATAHEPLFTTLSGIVFGLVLPLAMFAANRSAPLMVGLAALLALAGVAQAGRLPALLRPPAGGWSLASAATFLVFCALSLLWAHDQRVALFGFGEFIAAAVPGVLLYLAWRVALPMRLGRMLAVGLMLAALATLADLKSDMAFRIWMGIRIQNYVLNRTVIVQLVLLWPMALLLAARERWLGALAAGCVAVAIFSSESSSAMLGLLAGGAALALAVVLPRFAALGVMGVAAMLLVLAPWIGALVRLALPGNLHAALARAHSDDRVNIWLSFGAAVRERFAFGSGFNSSSAMAMDPLVLIIDPPLRPLLGAGHPHNAYLQVWVELGFIGALLALALLWVVTRALWRLRGAKQRLAIGMAAAILSVAAVSHGAWQGWWIATVGAALAIFIAQGDDHERI